MPATPPTAPASQPTPRWGGLQARVALPMLGAAVYLWGYVATRLGCDVAGQRIYAMADDQLISLRYARNLANGDGLVWNAGEAPVEGISNLLWTLWMALGHAVGIPDSHTSVWVYWASGASLLVTALFTAKVAARIMPAHRWAPTLALFGAAFYWPTIRWSMGGFEVGALAATCAAGAWYAMPRDREGETHADQLRAWNRLGAWAVVALMLRLDAAVLFAALGLVSLRRASDAAARRQIWLRFALPCVVVLIAMTVWRLSYYGQWVPNTFVLKGTGVDLWTRVVQGADALSNTFQTHMGILLVPMLLALAGPAEHARERSVLWSLAIAQTLFLLYIGGDTWEEERYANRQIATVMPVLMALTAAGFLHMHDRIAANGARRIALIATSLAAAMAFWITSARSAKAWMAYEHCKSMLWPKVELALHLKKVAPPDTRVAVVWAGAVPYFSGLPAVDLLGKSDPVIARTEPHHSFAGHNKWNYAHSVGKLQPHLIVEVYGAEPDTLKEIAGYGYRFMPDKIWYRKDVNLPPVHPPPKPKATAFLPQGHVAPEAVKTAGPGTG